MLFRSKLARRVDDPGLRARYHVANAWRYYRSGDHNQVRKHLSLAGDELQYAADKGMASLIAERRALELSQRRQYDEALNLFGEALEGYLAVGNYDHIQSCAGNLGNALHRMGEEHYEEARNWLLLSVKVCRLMRIGRDDCLNERSEERRVGKECRL